MDLRSLRILPILCIILACVQTAKPEEPSTSQTDTPPNTPSDTPPETPSNTPSDTPPEAKGSSPIKKIWKVEMAEIEEIEVIDYKEFESSHDYIIQTKPTIYYWLGEKTPQAEAGEAASYAVVKAFKTYSKVQIQKEVQGRESLAFRTVFRGDAVGPSSSESKTPNTSERRMFLIEEKFKNTNILILKEVAPSSYHTDNRKKTCAVIVEYKAFVFCQKGFTTAQKKSAEVLARIMMRRKGLNENEFETVPNNHAGFFDDFISDITPEITIAESEFTPAEMRQIFDQTEVHKDKREWFFIQVHRLYEDATGMVTFETILKDSRNALAKLFADVNVNLKKLNAKDCYVTDSQSNAGLFIWIGRESNIYVRKSTAKRAELLLKQDARYDHATPVTYIHQDSTPTGVNSMRELMEYFIAQKEGRGTTNNEKAIVKVH